MAGIPQSEGTTPSERYLAQLANRTFLGVWSHPSLYRNQGKGGTGKELVDLLVVFGEDAILFSDKACACPDSGDTKRDWRRWFRRAVLDGARQLRGAQRWLEEHPDRVFLDARCERPFPWPLTDVKRFHRVVVARGIVRRCRAEVGGSGSLVIDPRTAGGQHVDQQCDPFVVGDVDPAGGYIHVLDDIALEVVMREMDTTADFVMYLADREAAMKSGRFGRVEGEENLLAYYMCCAYKGKQVGFWVPNGPPLVIRRGEWERMLQHPAYSAKRVADRDSHAWDAVIQEFASTLRSGRAYWGEWDPIKMEKALRLMARMNRLQRRGVGRSVLKKIEEEMPEGRSLNFRTHFDPPDATDVAYALVVARRPDGMEYEEYRRIRRGVLARYCLFVRARFPRLRQLVGIATEPRQTDSRSWDIAHLDTTTWTDEDQRSALQGGAALGLSLDVVVRHETDERYPELPRS